MAVVSHFYANQYSHDAMWFGWGKPSYTTDIQIAMDTTSNIIATIESPNWNISEYVWNAARTTINATTTKNYWIRIQVNDGGWGAWVASSDNPVPFDISSPGPVSSVAAARVDSTSRKVNVTWNATGVSTGDLSAYYVYRSTSSTAPTDPYSFIGYTSYPAAQNLYVDTAPSDGTWYYYVRTGDFYDNFSTAKGAAGLAITTPPSAPTQAPTVTASGASFNIAMALPSGTGGTPTSYDLYRNDAFLKNVPYTGTTTTATDSPPAGQQYRYSFASKNSVGTSTVGPNSAYYTVATLPSIPVAPTATASGSTVSLSWGTGTGGLPESYTLYRKSSTGVVTTVKSVGGTSTTDSPGEGSWQYALSATNTIGTTPIGQYTDYVSVSTPPGIPTVPNVSVTGSVVNLSWTKGTGGTPTSYDVWRNNAFLKNVPTTSTTDAPGDGNWQYAVKAINAAGTSSLSAYSNYYTVVGALPPPPATEVGEVRASTGNSINLLWELMLCDPATGADISPLLEASNVSFNVPLMEPASVSFTVPTIALESSLVQAMYTDVKLYMNNIVMFRGRLMNPRRTFGSDASTLSIVAFSYKEMLKRRFLEPTDAPVTTGYAAGTDIAAIGAGLINVAQAKTNGSFGIDTTSYVNSGITVSAVRKFQAGQSIYDAINSIASSNSTSTANEVIEWDINPNNNALIYEMYSSKGGSVRGRGEAVFTAQIGSSVISGTETSDASKFANFFHVRGYDDQYYTSVGHTGDSFDYTNSKVGRWDSFVSDTALLDAASTSSRANYLNAMFSQFIPAYQLEIEPSHWNSPNQLWVGDYVILDLNQDGWSVLRSDLRCTNLSFQFNPDGDYSLQIEVSLPLPADLTLQSLASRVKIAEQIWDALNAEVKRQEAIADADENRTAQEEANIEAARQQREAFQTLFPGYKFTT